MYKATHDSKLLVHYGFHLHIPKYGWGINITTGEAERVDILKRSPNQAEQYWERTPLPADWKKKRKAEDRRQEEDPNYVDPDLEQFREQEWRRRLCGVWLWNKGEPIYLTGLHYFYINWWCIDIGYPKYRKPDRLFFYVLLFCLLDPFCGGLLEATKRRQGKTYRGACWVYETVSRSKDSDGGLQSKTGPDARDVVFKKALIKPFKKLPDFFMPTFDTSKGVTPTSSLDFVHATKRGSAAFDNIDNPELNSKIDWTNADRYAYDGTKKKALFEDEIGKTDEEDVYERHLVNKYCLETDAEWTGFKLGSTTVEDMNSGGGPFKKLWDESDVDDRDDNGHTKTGMYRYMTPAYETLFFHPQYGDPDVEKAKVYYMNRRAKLDGRALSSDIRKNPFTEQEMFRIDGERCTFSNPENVNEQIDWLSYHPDILERGNFEWKNNERFSEVIWKKAKNGRWQMPVAFEIEHANHVEKISGKYYPRNTLNFRIGCDPFKYDKVKDKRRSDCAAFVGRMYDPLNPSGPFSDTFVCRYRFRAATTSMANEDILKMAWYFGCQALFERNVDHWKPYFIEHGCAAFLMKIDGEDEYGIYSDGHGGLIQSICEHLEDFIEHSSKKLYFIETGQEWLAFDPGETTKFDETIASGLTRVAMKRKVYRRSGSNGMDVNTIVKIRKAG